MKRSVLSLNFLMIFFPERFVQAFLPDKVLSGLVTQSGNVRSSAYSVLARTDLFNQRELKQSLEEVSAEYQKSIATAPDRDLTKSARREEIVKDPKLFKERMKNLAVYHEVQNIKKEHKGKRYRWLASGATTPRPEHALLYGKIFEIGEGDDNGNMPGEEYGCQCGMEIIED